MSGKPKQGLLDLRRDAVLPNVRVTPEEKARFEKLAEARHLKLSTFIRVLLHEEAEKAAKAEKGKAA